MTGMSDYTACGTPLIAANLGAGGTARVNVYCELPVDHEGVHAASIEWEHPPHVVRIAQGSDKLYADALASRDASLAAVEALCVEAETPPMHSMIPLGCVRVSEVRAALHSDPSEATCSGAGDCPASLHVHGCFADRDGAVCDDPSVHDLAPTSRPDVESPSGERGSRENRG